MPLFPICCLWSTGIHTFRLRSFLHVRAASAILTRMQNGGKSYNPQGSCPCERYNGLIWKTIQLAASTRKCSINNWENLLPVCHQITIMYSHQCLPTRKISTPPMMEFSLDFTSHLALSTRYGSTEMPHSLYQT